MRFVGLDRVTRSRRAHRLRWFAGGTGALLLVLSSAAWWLVPVAAASIH